MIAAAADRPILTEVLACLDRGWYITPLCWPDANGRCACPKHHTIEKDIGKAPLLGKGYQNRRLSQEEIERVFAKYPRANYGILLRPSNLLVTDADSAGADREVEAWGVPPGPRVRTAHGFHRFFANTAEVIGRTTKRGDSHSLDVLSDGYVVGPGSLHRTGARYAWEVSPEECPLEDAPAWAVALLQESVKVTAELECLLGTLPAVDVDTLAIPLAVRLLVRHGPLGDVSKYPSRSEAVFAVLMALLRAGVTDTATLAGIFLDPHYWISEKPREQGRAWVASEIARAKAKYNGNGYHPAPWPSDEDAPPHGEANGHDPEADEVENARIVQDERAPEPPSSLYPCPDILWQGVFARAAEAIGKRSWEVWTGIYGALSAVAHRNLHFYYYSDHLYGNSYSLLVNDTGAGKNLVVNTCRTLLPETHTVRVSIQSGPALIPLLTADELKNKSGRLTLQGRPVILLCSEWSRLLGVGGIEHSTLIEDLNDLHMRHWPWTFARSHKNQSGGDLVITEPSLTIVGTTTRKLFHAALTDRSISSGMINRYLILPGSAEFEAYTGRSYKPNGLRGQLDHLKAYAWGLGQEIRDAYRPEAWAAFLAFQDSFLLPLQRNPETSETLKRLHLHWQHLAALYAWQEQAAHIALAHVEAAKAILQVSHTFVLSLLEERASAFEPTKIQANEAAMEQQAIAKLKRTPGLTKREGARHLSNGTKAGYIAWGRVFDSLLQAGVLFTKKTGQRQELYVSAEY